MIEIRQAKMTDKKRLAELSIRSSKDSWTETNFEGALRLSYATVWIAEDMMEHELVGYAVVYRGVDMEELVNIAVDVNYRRQQIGSGLMEHLLYQASEKDVRNISLEVRESNEAAVALYEKYGFRTLGKRHGFYQNPSENALILGRDFRW